MSKALGPMPHVCSKACSRPCSNACFRCSKVRYKVQVQNLLSKVQSLMSNVQGSFQCLMSNVKVIMFNVKGLLSTVQCPRLVLRSNVQDQGCSTTLHRETIQELSIRPQNTRINWHQNDFIVLLKMSFRTESPEASKRFQSGPLKPAFKWFSRTHRVVFPL